MTVTKPFKYFAIAYPDNEKRVSLLCEHNGMSGTTRKFTVINGAWQGFIREDGMVFVSRASKKPDAIKISKIVWEGDTYPGDYNQAIAWIEERLASC